MKAIPTMEARTATLLIALALGCGLAFHPMFFAAAAGIAALIVILWTANELGKFLVHFTNRRRLAH